MDLRNKIYVDQNFGWGIGNFKDNKNHRHFAIQIVIPLQGFIRVASEFNSIESSGPIIISSNSLHKLSTSSRVFVLLLNPLSSIGHYWKINEMKGIAEVENSILEEIKEVILNKETDAFRINEIILEVYSYYKSKIQITDDRIACAVDYMMENSERVLSLKEVAGKAHLSESRFLHLFKQQTGITFRRSQLWNKVLLALRMIKHHDITKSAYLSGFADSSHFSRVFKETFGYSPRSFLKNSQFIQV